MVVVGEACPLAALMKSLWLTLMGVFDPVHACNIVAYTLCTSAMSSVPRHLAVLVMKLPLLPQKQVLSSLAVEPEHFDLLAALLRHDCAFFG